jgi:hypothetical protein
MKRLDLPWASLRVGQSFVFPPAQSLRATQRHATARAAYQRKKHGRNFVVRTQPRPAGAEVRIWRVV